MNDSKRVFLAILLPIEVKNSIHRFCRPLSKLALDIKWVDSGNYHLTMKFFGDLYDEDIQRVSVFLESLATQIQPFSLKCGKLMAFPNWHHPRVLTLSLDGDVGPLHNLWRRLETGLIEIGFAEENRRRFKPHITLGRFRGVGNYQENLMRKAIDYSLITSDKCLIGELCLMASRLTPKGPEYSLLCSYPFQG